VPGQEHSIQISAAIIDSDKSKLMILEHMLRDLWAFEFKQTKAKTLVLDLNPQQLFKDLCLLRGI
jgi:hypothetical protein